MVKARILNRIAIIVLAMPVALWLLCEMLPRIVPGCYAQMYGTNHCVVGSVEISSLLVWGGIASIAFFFVAGVFVALPLLVIARILSARERGEDNAA